MRRSKKRRRRNVRGRRELLHAATSIAAVTEESRASVAVTVFWMIALLATLLAELVALGAYAIRPWMGEGVSTLAFPVAITVAAITGGSALLGMLAARFVRTVPPPTIVTWSCLLIALPPLAYFLVSL